MEPKGGEAVRFRALVCGLAMIVVVLVGCSSEESAEVTFSAGRFGVQPTSEITASGAAVDQGLVCHQVLEYSAPRYENLAGEEIPGSEWQDLLYADWESGTVFEGVSHRVWNCADGSGALEVTYETRLDFSEDVHGKLDAGTWRISGGTGAYSGLTGSGDVVVNFDGNNVTYSGEVKTG